MPGTQAKTTTLSFLCVVMAVVLAGCTVPPPPVYTPPTAQTPAEARSTGVDLGGDAVTTAKEELTFAPPLLGVGNNVDAMRGPATGFADYLSSATGITTSAFVPTDYGNTLLGVREGKLDIVYLPAAFWIKARDELGVTPLASVSVDGSSSETGLILVRAGSDLSDLADLEDRAIAAANLESAAAWVVPAAALQEAGVDPFADVDARFTGDDAESITLLLEEEVDAAFVRARSLQDEAVLADFPDVAERTTVLAEFPDLPIGVIALRQGVTAEQRAQLESLLSAEETAGQVETHFGWDGLVPYDEAAFDSVRDAATTLGMVEER